MIASLIDTPSCVLVYYIQALNYRKYSTFSDCYSYGMVLYEIWSVGREPLPGVSLKEVGVKLYQVENY